MRIDRFFIEEKISGKQVLVRNDELMHQWKHVFRYQVGAQVILLDNTGYEYMAHIESLTNREAVCVVSDKKEALRPRRDMWLYMASIKKDKFEHIIQQYFKK